MAIQKEIELENGVTLNYHRITSLEKITNISNNIEVSSYTNETQRQKEQEYQQLQLKNQKETLSEQEQEQLNKGINVFIDTDYIQIPYNEEMTIQDAYNYLLTLDKYKGAKQV